MAALTEYARDKVRDKVARNTNFTSPTTLYFAAFTTVTTDGGGGTEVTGGSYARQTVTFNAGATGTGEASPSATITIASMPACTIVAVAFYDASTAGNMWIHGQLATSITLTGGQTLSIPTSDILLRFR